MALPTTVWLRAEGAAMLALSVLLYTRTGEGWLLFILLLLVPDLSMLGYLGGPRVGAIAYNVVHTYATPIVLAGLGVLTGSALVMALALIWTAHIGLDRMFGYGLKLPTGFQDTHLGRIGKGA